MCVMVVGSWVKGSWVKGEGLMVLRCAGDMVTEGANLMRVC
jgi:hypothetical protein